MSEHPLDVWAKGNGRKVKWLLQQLDVSAAALGLWRHGRRCPSPPLMMKINQLTEGAVSPLDCIQYYCDNRRAK